MNRFRAGCTFGLGLALCATASAPARAQTAPERSAGWDETTTILAASSLAIETFLPRVFSSDPDVTEGWKARWHVSVLAPTATLTSLALLNEQSLKGAFGLSTQSFVAGSALGQGTAVFLVDTLRWSHGNINPASLVGQVGVPLVLAPIVAFGRTAGNLETGAQSWGGAGIGLLAGFGLGLGYALLQRPECGYTGDLICW